MSKEPTTFTNPDIPGEPPSSRQSQRRTDMSQLVDIYVECGEILEERGKQHEEPFAVVEAAARIANTDVSSIFKALIAMKLARVESDVSVHDSLIDAANYCMLWLAWKEENHV